MSKVREIPLDEDGNPISTGSGSEFLDSYTHNDPAPTQIGPPMVDPPRSGEGENPKSKGANTDMIGGFLDFYNKQKSPIFNRDGNVTGYNHGYGNIENFDKPIPKDQYTGPGHSLGNDQMSEAEARKLSPALGNMLDKIDNNTLAGNNENTSNTIDTSTQSENMSTTGNNNNGANQLANYLGSLNNVRNITPQFRPRSMVDVELDRGGRISPLIAVGQHRDSPSMGYTNDFASAPSSFLNFYSGGAGVPSGPGNMGQQTDSGNIGGQQASGQGSAAGAGNFGGPNINISNVNNPQAVANTGTIKDSTISNTATGEASQTSEGNTNTNTNTNQPEYVPPGNGGNNNGGNNNNDDDIVIDDPITCGDGTTLNAAGTACEAIPAGPTTSDTVDKFIANTAAGSQKTQSAFPDYQSPYYNSAAEKATEQAKTLFTGNTLEADDGSLYNEMISGSNFTGGGGAVTAESLGKEADAPLNFVQQSYQDIFGRAPDKEGYDYWTSELNTGSLTPDAFIASLQGSPEAKSRSETGQGGKGLLYQDVDDYLAGGGVGGTPSASAYMQDDDVPSVDTTEYSAPATTAASQTADDWLQDFYNEAGLGTVDAGGRAYWEGDLAGGQTKEQIKANIMLHKK